MTRLTLYAKEDSRHWGCLAHWGISIGRGQAGLGKGSKAGLNNGTVTYLARCFTGGIVEMISVWANRLQLFDGKMRELRLYSHMSKRRKKCFCRQ